MTQDFVAALHRVSGTLTATAPVDEQAQEVIDILEQMLGLDFGAILLTDPLSGRLAPLALSRQGHDENFIRKDKEFVRTNMQDSTGGITQWVARNAETVRASDVSRDARYVGLREGVRSELCVPICSESEVLGVLNTETNRVGAYSQTDELCLEIVAAELSLVLQCSALRRVLCEDDHAKGGHALVPMCSCCKSLRVADSWQPVEPFLGRGLGVQFTHGYCPACYETVARPQLDDLSSDGQPSES